jgi:hypothetical protein
MKKNGRMDQVSFLYLAGILVLFFWDYPLDIFQRNPCHFMGILTKAPKDDRGRDIPAILGSWSLDYVFFAVPMGCLLPFSS